MQNSHKLTLLMVCVLSACASKQRGTPDNEPTLKTLASRTVTVEKDAGVAANPSQAIAAYRGFLAVAPKAPQREEAMRRIGDLEMDSADIQNENPQATGGPDYKAAVARYQDVLKAYPNSPGNDRVLYQLARAQEQSGDLESALKTLDRLVKNYPATTHGDEAQFRRGELLFTARNYTQAEQAYATVLGRGTAGRYHDRALYMQGWSQFKQGRLEEAVQSFFGVLDAKLANSGDGQLESIKGLTRADRELVEDTFRVTSLSLANLKGAESIAPYINSPARQNYAFRVYEQLGELYLKQERVKDAADTFALFARNSPLDAQAPIFQARVIGVYERNGFAMLALDAKREYVARYGSASALRKSNPEGWQKAQPLVQTHMAELARHYHASAQKSKRTADYQEAVRWYRDYLTAFPKDPQSAQNNFLLAELLFEDGQYAQATAEYEKTAYVYPPHAASADAGYATLLGYAQQQKKAGPAELPTLQQASVASALRFADTFGADSRAAAVLADASETLLALKNPAQATAVAQKLLDRQPAAPDAQRRVAWTVLAHTRFDAGNFAGAEQAYNQVLQLTADKAAGRDAVVERHAAAIYKQGEQARTAGETRAAVGHFERIARVAPQSTVQAAAQYDAAASHIALKDWDAAARALEDFRKRYPKHPLQAEVGSKLAVVYVEKGQWANAATEFEGLATTHKDPAISRDALWQAAELHEKANARPAATKAYERYLAQNPQPLEPALEARHRLARLAKEDRNPTRVLALQKDIFQADQSAGTARTDRTRYLGATAALALAEPVAEAYRKVTLTEPLQKQLKLKKTKMEEALKAYAVATDMGVADVTTEASYRIATVYRDFGKALLASERPKKLNKAEREQYNVLLEEQAFPFEEKATEIHALNAQRAASGIYDQWVKSSFDALRELRPVRYSKTERLEGKGPEQAVSLTQQGITQRQAGQFDKARQAYEKAIALDANYTPAILNLGILQDLYLGDSKQALVLYERYLSLTPSGDATVAKWVADLKNRKEKA
ncbi:MAG: tetratricopeptide repeat protein [Pseudomonadota bacterium]